jgi:hypothetical protein
MRRPDDGAFLKRTTSEILLFKSSSLTVDWKLNQQGMTRANNFAIFNVLRIDGDLAGFS